MRTDIAREILIIAKRVLENVAAGRVYPQSNIDWAQAIVNANTPKGEHANAEDCADRSDSAIASEVGR